jgi:hypothetical protein
VIRQHWGIENKLHWVLEVGFGEDSDRKRAGHAAQNFSILKPNRLNLLKQDQSSNAESRESASKPLGTSPICWESDMSRPWALMDSDTRFWSLDQAIVNGFVQRNRSCRRPNSTAGNFAQATTRPIHWADRRREAHSTKEAH